MEKKETADKKVVKFSKNELLNCKVFKCFEVDLLAVLLEDKQYSVDECKGMLEKELGRKVK